MGHNGTLFPRKWNENELLGLGRQRQLLPTHIYNDSCRDTVDYSEREAKCDARICEFVVIAPQISFCLGENAVHLAKIKMS